MKPISQYSHAFLMLSLISKKCLTLSKNFSLSKYLSFETSFVLWTIIAKSLVMNPCSTHSMVAASNDSQKCFNSLLLSKVALCKNPLVQAKILAIELVDVSFPC